MSPTLSTADREVPTGTERMARSLFSTDPWELLPSRVLWREWWITVAGLAVLCTLLTAQGGLQGFDRALYDEWLVFSAAPPRPDVVLIGLDRPNPAATGASEASIQQTAAALLERLAGVPVRAIGLALPWRGAPRSDSETSDAAALGEAIERAGPVVLAEPEGARDAIPPELAAGAHGVGFRDYREDPDGLVRRAPLSTAPSGGVRSQDNWIVALVRAAHAPVDLPSSTERLSNPGDGREWVQIVGIPLSHPAARAFPLYSSAAVLSGEVPLRTFAHKFVLIGTAGALPERPVAVPGEGLFAPAAALPALQVDAQLLAGLLDGRAIVALSALQVALASGVAVTLALLMLLLPVRGLSSTVLTALLTLVASMLLLTWGHLWFPPSAAVLCVGLTLPVWRWRELRMTSVLLDRQFAQLESEPGSFAERPMAQIAERAPVGRWRFVAAARALARVYELRRFLARFVDDLGIAALVVNLDGHVIFANRAARLYFAALGNTQIDGAQLPYLLSALAPVGAPPDFSWWDSLAAGPAPTRASGRDPVGRDITVHAGSWSAPGGELAGWVVTLLDISAIGAAERMRDTALHFMTGDLCGPVQGILALVREGQQGAEPIELLDAIEGEAQYALELAEKFVQLTIAATHAYVLRVRPVHESVLLAVDANEPLAEGRGSTIRFEGHEAPQYAEIDPDMFWKAVHTLILNALRFGPDASVVEVRLEALAETCEIVVGIRDNGPGIAGSEQARLVRMFQSIDLPGAHRHRGRVEFTSNPGKGTDFRIILPAAAAAPEPDRTRPTPAPHGGAV